MAQSLTSATTKSLVDFDQRSDKRGAARQLAAPPISPAPCTAEDQAAELHCRKGKWESKASSFPLALKSKNRHRYTAFACSAICFSVCPNAGFHRKRVEIETQRPQDENSRISDVVAVKLLIATGEDDAETASGELRFGRRPVQSKSGSLQ